MSRTLTIEDMIKQGASWADIKTRVAELQKEEAERQAAERAKAREEATRAKQSAAALDRMIAGFADWCIAEGLLPEDKRAEFMDAAREGFDELASDARQVMVISSLLRR